MSKFISIFGWYGTVAILLAYLLNGLSLMEANNIWYILLNITGGVGVATVAYSKRTYQPVVMNVVWVVVGVIALVKLII
jgi:hypothetical protein